MQDTTPTSPVQTPVAALILGAAVWADGPSPTLRRRTLQAARLYHSGAVSHLIPCGGLGRHPPAEAQVMHDILVQAGVPPAAIRLEGSSTSTVENIRLALPLLLAGLDVHQTVIVTDAWHTPRARLIARRLGLTATSSSPPLAGASLRQFLKSALREIPAYVWAALTLYR